MFGHLKGLQIKRTIYIDRLEIMKHTFSQTLSINYYPNNPSLPLCSLALLLISTTNISFIVLSIVQREYFAVFRLRSLCSFLLCRDNISQLLNCKVYASFTWWCRDNIFSKFLLPPISAPLLAVIKQRTLRSCLLYRDNISQFIIYMKKNYLILISW